MSDEPIKSENLPATQRQLEWVRQELKGDITTVRLEMKAGFQSIDSRFAEMDARFTAIDSRFIEMEARFTGIDSRFIEMEARFTGIESRFTGIEGEFKGIAGQFTALDARFERIESILWGMKAMMEEQNTKILYALDGYNFLSEKIDRSEKRFEKIEQKVFGVEQN